MYISNKHHWSSLEQSKYVFSYNCSKIVYIFDYFICPDCSEERQALKDCTIIYNVTGNMWFYYETVIIAFNKDWILFANSSSRACISKRDMA